MTGAFAGTEGVHVLMATTEALCAKTHVEAAAQSIGLIDFSVLTHNVGTISESGREIYEQVIKDAAMTPNDVEEMFAAEKLVLAHFYTQEMIELLKEGAKTKFCRSENRQ